MVTGRHLRTVTSGEESGADLLYPYRVAFGRARKEVYVLGEISADDRLQMETFWSICSCAPWLYPSLLRIYYVLEHVFC